MSVDHATVLVTGGTGSFGRKFVDHLLNHHEPRVIRIYSRDELKQSEMARELAPHQDRLRFFIGDVRDQARLSRAMEGVDVVVHAAALKQVPVCENDPFEAVKTNILGAQHVIDAALSLNVPRVLALSTDKAANPANLYGATKLCAEKMFTAAISYAGAKPCRISCVRYGNVVGSRGSVIPLFAQQRRSGRLTITDERMTRFWMTLDQAVQFVVDCLGRMKGGEIFIPKIPSCRVVDLAEAIAPDTVHAVVGIRPGEKLHEVLLTEDEARNAQEHDTFFVVEPRYPGQGDRRWTDGRQLPDGFRYSSDSNPDRLNPAQLRTLVAPFLGSI